MKKGWLFATVCVVLVGCTGAEVRENFGLSRRSPDAFNVVSRPPLTVPKEFYLTAPTVGEDAVLGERPDVKARALLTSSDAAEASAPASSASPEAAGAQAVFGAAPASVSASAATAAESGLLQKAGADKADAQVKQALHTEAVAAEKAQEDASLLDQFRQGLGGASQANAVIDPAKESKELQKQQIPTNAPKE